MYTDKENYVESEMYVFRSNALDKLTGIVHHNFKERFAMVLANSYLDEDNNAKKIADQLNLERIDFFALLEEKEIFEELLLKDLLDEQGEAAYDRKFG